MTLIDKINDAIQANNTEQSHVTVGRAPQFPVARSYISPTDSYEDSLGPQTLADTFSPGAMRAMWAVADQQQASVPVTAITSSGNTKSANLSAIQGGAKQNPVAPKTVWSAVPSLITSLQVQGPVMIQANVSVRSSVANDVAGFAIYRDGRLIGNHLNQTMPSSVSAVTIVQLAVMDNPPPGLHVYSMQWSPGTGTLTANSNQRNLYTINLSPQG